MADTAALKLGNLISSKISGTIQDFGSGLKGAFIGANPAVFGPMAGILSKGFGGLTKQTQVQAKTQQEQTQREAGFREEADNERKRYEQILLSVQKGMAINIEEIQKDVRQILELMKESLWDKLKNLFGAFALIPKKIAEFLKFLKDVLSKIPNFFKNLFKGLGTLKLPNIGDFTQKLKNWFEKFKLPSYDNFIKRIGDFFNRIKFPDTAKVLSQWFDRFKKALRLDDLKDILKLDRLKEMFKLGGVKSGFGGLFKTLASELDLLRLDLFVRFQNLKNGISTKISDLGKVITESDFVKGAQTLFSDIKGKFVSLGTSITTLKTTLLNSIGESIRVFKESNLVKAFGSVAEDIGRIGKTIAAPFMSLGDAIAKDVSQIRDTFRASVIPVAAAGDVAKVGDVADTVRDVAKVGDVADTAKDALKVGDALDAIKDTEKITDAVKSVGLLGGIFAKIGDIGKGIGSVLAGPLKMFGELTDVAPFLKTVGKVLGPIGLIMSVFDGLSLAFNTEKLQKYFGKEDIGMQERISGFIGGFIGGFGGIIDMLAGAMGFEDTTFQEDMSKNISQGMNKVFDGIKAVFTFIGDILRSEPAKALFGAIKETGSKLVEGLSGLFGFIKDVFMSDAMKTVFETIGGLVAESIKNSIKILGSLVDLIVGVFTFDGEKIAKAGKDIWETVTTGIKNSFKMIGNVIEQALQWVYNKIFGWWKSGSDKPIATGADADGMGVSKEFDTGSADVDTSPPTPSRAPAPSPDKPSGPATGGMPPAPPVGPEAGRGYRRYSEADLVKEGLKIKPGYTQKAGTEIHPSTVEAAKNIQRNFSIDRFTGFNDGYVRRERGGEDPHKKGLAFDFTLPPELARNDDYRNSLVESVRKAGFFIIDEYAYPSSRATAGHFHVELGRGPGKMVGPGKYSVGGGGDPSKIAPKGGAPSPAPATSGGPGPQLPAPSVNLYEGVYGEDSGVSAGRAPGDTTPGAPNVTARPTQPQYTVVTRPKILSPEEAYKFAQDIAYYDAEKKRYDEEKKYRDERAQLENKFYRDLESMVRPMVTALQGPAGSMDPALARDAGKNLAAGMQADFTKLGTALFGKQYGAAMGTTFQQLAGSYLDQFINQALAPAMGVDAEVLNRSINLYAKGKEFATKTLAPAQKALDDARVALQAKEKEVGISKASIIRASGLGKSLSADQLSKIAQLETMRKGVTDQESKVNDLKKQRRQYNQVALEDLFFGMTGVPTGARSLIEQYGGADALTRDISTMIGAPFSPAFRLGEKGPLAGPGVDPRIALDARLKQTEEVLIEGGQVVAVKSAEGVASGGVKAGDIIYEKTVSAGEVAAQRMYDKVSSITIGVSGPGGYQTASGMTSTYMDFDKVVESTLTSSLTSSIKTAFEETPFGLANMEPAGGGTSIPGYVDDGSYDRVEAARFARQTSAMGPSSTARLPVNTGKMMDFGQNMLYNMLGSKVSSAFGGGMSGNILGRAAQGALRGAFSGGDIVQNIGAQFGMKLAPGAGIGDLLGGVSSMFTNQITSMGSMFTNLATSKLMPGFMGQGVMDFGTGIQAAGGGLSGLTGAFGSGNLSHMAGAAAGGLMAGMQGYGISKALSGGYSTGGNTVNLLAGIGSAFFGPIAGVIGGLVNRAFGRKAKETKAQGFSGTFSTEGADIKQFTDWFQKGGWLRSNKSGTELKAVDEETAKAFSDTVKDTTKTVESLGKVLGFDPTKTKGFSKDIKIDLKGLNEKQQQEAIQKAFKEYGAGLVGSSFKYVGQFTKGKEDQLDTLSRLAGASETFKSVMTGPDVKKILGLDSADTIKQLITKQFAGITNMDAAVKDYLGGGKGMMEFGDTGTVRMFDVAFKNVFSRFNLDPISDVAQNIIGAFTGSLQDQAGSLKEYLNTYIADFQSQLIDAYGGAEEFQKVESSLFDLLYTEEEKKAKLQELTAQQMKEAAQNLKDAGVAIDPEKLGATFADNQKAAKDMLTAADKDLASGKITKDQYATIRKSAADFLTAAKKNSELSKDGKTVSGGTSTFKAMTPEDAAKLVFPPGTLAPIQNVISTGQANSVVAFTTGSNTIATAATASANTITTATQTAVAAGTSAIATSSSETVTSIIDKITLGQSTLEQAITSGIIRVTDSSANGVQKIISEVATGKTTLTDAFASGALTISTTSASGANTISTSASSQAQVLERLITDFINSSGTFANAVNGLNGSIGTLENAVSNFDFGGAGTGDGGASAAAAGDDGSASDGGAGGGADGGSAGDGSGGVGGGGVGVGGGDGSGGGGAGDGSAWARGGRFAGRRPMIVGEVGPEVMVPGFAGTIVPTHKIIEAVQNAAALDSQTRNLLLNAAPAPNPVSIVYMDQENANKSLNKERSMGSPVNNAVVDNSVTQVSSPQTTVINGAGDVRSTHPISGMFTRAMIGARGF